MKVRAVLEGQLPDLGPLTRCPECGSLVRYERADGEARLVEHPSEGRTDPETKRIWLKPCPGAGASVPGIPDAEPPAIEFDADDDEDLEKLAAQLNDSSPSFERGLVWRVERVVEH